MIRLTILTYNGPRLMDFSAYLYACGYIDALWAEGLIATEERKRCRAEIEKWRQEMNEAESPFRAHARPVLEGKAQA